METIGVIIPNYNSGKYINKCLDSLLKQEYKINEIIVIDDHSTDDSIKTIREYAKKNKSIILLENDVNKGVSYSRNRGIEYAKSDYLMFCDADDWYEKEATKKMMKVVKKECADFVFAGLYITYKDGKKLQVKYNNFNEDVITKEECISNLPITSASKLIKKTLFLDNNIKYSCEVKNCEELPVIPIVAFYAKKVIYINECLYNYFQRGTSASNKKLQNLNFYDITFEEFKKNLPSKYKQAISIRMIEHLLYSKTYSLVKDNFSKIEILENINKCKKELDGQNIKMLLTKFPYRKKIFIKCSLKGLIFPLKLYVMIQQKMIGE